MWLKIRSRNSKGIKETKGQSVEEKQTECFHIIHSKTPLLGPPACKREGNIVHSDLRVQYIIHDHGLWLIHLWPLLCFENPSEL